MVQIGFAKVETDREQSLATRYDIRSIPTPELFHQMCRGALDAAGIERWLSSQLPRV